MTPEQMRALAEEPLMYNEAGVKFRGRAGKPIDELRAALRAAADQLEAVQAWALTFDYATDPWADLLAILSTNPQEPSDV